MKKVDKRLRDISCIYIIKCLENGKCYVGQTKNLQRRLREHLYSLRKNTARNSYLQADYNKYGIDAFDYEILYKSNDNLDDKEREYIAKYREAGLCYNIFSGGLIGYEVPQSFKDNVSKRTKGVKHSAETRKKQSENTKRQWKECTGYAEKMSESAKKQWQDPVFRNKVIGVHIGKCAPNMCKMTKENVLEARRRFANGEKLSVMAKEFGVKYDAMYKAVHKVTWRYI